MPEEVEAPEKAKAERRRIPGNLPYTATYGGLKKALDKIVSSEKPKVFNNDFVATVLQVPGGSGRPIPPILKAVGFVDASGTPTELYSQFQTEAGRANAALQALRTGYAEVFRRNQYAHKADDKTLTDIIVAITGVPKTEAVVRNILKTFQIFQGFSAGASEEPRAGIEPSERLNGSTSVSTPAAESPSNLNGNLGLVYNINVVLPETTNPEVYNAIFRSLKANLLP